MPTASFNPNSGGGFRGTTNPTWATARGATSGVDGSADHQILSVGGYYLRRSFLNFDLSSLAGMIITGWRLKLAREDAVISFGNDNSTTLEVVPSSQVDPTSLVANDFDNVSFVSKGSIPLASTVNNTYFTITGADLAMIVPGGFTQFALITGKDLANVAPTGTGGQIGISNYLAARPPVLEVDYIPPDLGSPIFFRGGGYSWIKKLFLPFLRFWGRL